MDFELTERQVMEANDVNRDASENPAVLVRATPALSCEMFEGGLGI